MRLFQCSAYVWAFRVYVWNLEQRYVGSLGGVGLLTDQIRELHMPRHGIISSVSLDKSDVFENAKDFDVTSYHSLHVNLDPLGRQETKSNGTASIDIKPLAWDFSDSENGTVLMAARHKHLPFWGVQYHPESICTTLPGKRVVSDWWRLAKRWIDSHHRTIKTGNVPRPSKCLVLEDSRQASATIASSHLHDLEELGIVISSGRVTWREFDASNPNILKLCEAFGLERGEALVFQSGRLTNGQPVNPELGRYSMIGFVDDTSLHLQYGACERRLTLRHQPTSMSDRVIKESRVPDLWAYIQRLMQVLKCEFGPASSPFWGGLMGYISYEAGLQSISVPVRHNMESESAAHTERPDVHFVYVPRSIVIDHVSGTGWIQTTLPADKAFLDSTEERIAFLKESNGTTNGGSQANSVSQLSEGGICKQNQLKLVSVDYPTKSEYIKKIQECNAFIRKGDSYELCLTSQSKVTVQNLGQQPADWSFFHRLSESNPATFSSYLRLKSRDDGLTIVGSSPERFLSWNRIGDCQFRPIKGTVKKSPTVGLAEATKILSSSKERAENLMIADLIRHDLHGIAGAGHVHVTKLMQIEEYATVFQLVSVIEGDLRPTNPRRRYSNSERQKQQLNGIDVLAASLPPGSMTGAPKKRSCEILLEIEEHKPRGIYSGVIGYLDVGGGGDFSVVIRTAYKWDSDNKFCSPENGTNGHNDAESQELQQWTIGAGGAITAQSDPGEEYREMLVKLNSVLGAFNTQLKD
jgi:para-aminobenzoate synthetase